ncbi:MAG: hypothetical protein RL621_1743, partial [Bacteroidota bacterium]
MVFIAFQANLSLNAQQANYLLLRDSLDYSSIKNNINSNKQQFNPIPYNNGLIFVSNKTTAFNKIGYNKVYW